MEVTDDQTLAEIVVDNPASDFLLTIINKKDGKVEMAFNPKFDTPAGDYKIEITVKDSDDIEVKKKFKLSIVEDAAFDAN